MSMVITKHGTPQKISGGYNFVCKKCGCEWNANRGDKGLKFSPPCCEFYTYMKCPNCGKEVIGEQ